MNINRYYKLLFFSIVCLYSFLFSPFQYDDTDGGYVMAFAWRIANGEIPYKDFIISKPALSAYIHTISILLLPQFLQYAFEKFLMYVFIAAYSYLFVNTISRFFDFTSLNLNKWLLTIVCFLFSAHTFPAMPWQTIDGILLGTVGLFFIFRKNSYPYIILGFLFLFLSALTKQSFYPMPFVGLILIYLLYKNINTLLSSILSLSVFIALFLIYLTTNDILYNYIYWTTGITKISDLINIGIINYIFSLSLKEILLSVILFLLIWLSSFFLFKKKLRPSLFPYILLSMFFAIAIYRCIYYYCIFCYQFTYPQLLFIVALFYLAIKIYKNPADKSHIIIFGFLSLSWCCSLSWGYPTPLLFFPPIIFMFLLFSKEVFKTNELFYKYVLYLSLSGFITLNTFSFYPGKHGKKHEMKYHLGEIYPKLTFNYTDLKTYQKYMELKKIIERHGNNFSVLPGIPMAHFFTNTTPTLAADWMLDPDLNNDIDFFIDDFKEKKVYIIYEKHTMFSYDSNISKQILEYCNLVENYNHFLIYKPKKTHE